MKIKYKYWFSIFVFLPSFFLTLSSRAYATRNPSAVYCEQLGYEFLIITDQTGNQVGMCKFPDGRVCSAFEFLKGQCGQKFSYCQKEGYSLKVEKDPQKCGYMVVPCSICLSKDGREIGEVTQIMKLDLREGKCGDHNCVIGENHNNCPQDCLEGSENLEKSAHKNSIINFFISILSWLILKIKEFWVFLLGLLNH